MQAIGLRSRRRDTPNVAVTFYGVNHPMAAKLWAKKLFVDAISATWIDKFVGEGTSSVIQRLMPRNKGAGDQITYGLRSRLTGDGKQGHEKLEGNEEALSIYSDSLLINKTRHAVRVGGEGSISQERVPFNIRDEARAGLSDWWAERIDYAAALQLTGSPFRFNADTQTWSTATNTNFSGNNPVLAPDTDHILLANPAAANEAALANASTDFFTLTTLDRAVARAKTLQPRVRPVMMDGKEMYVAFLHPFHTFQLRTNTNPGQWLDIQASAMMGGDVKNNPIFTGALGVYNNIILHEWDKLPPGVAANGSTPLTNVRRSVLCGAQAGAIGFGSQSNGDATDAFKWVEDFFDYEDELGVAVGGIYGLKKSRFNGKDFGTIVMSSYTPPVV